jgi:LysM repeat protein
MRRRVVWISLLVICACLAPLALAQEQVSRNLLQDGDFEAPPTWPMQDGIGEVQVAPGWRAYYLDAPPKYVELPSNCDNLRQAQCYWMRPEFRDNTSFANRNHSGERSQKYFSYGRMHEAGLLQQVSGIPPGARVRFSIWMQAWMCSKPDACGRNGEKSDAPADMHLRVGIDPLGGTDPFTGTVVWSAEQPAWDKFVLFQIETTAISNTVTVLTHSRAEWPWARLNNDVYLDDASLVIVGAYTTPTATMTLTGAVRAAAPTPTATRTPFPPGAVTHTVDMGDTLFNLALEYHVPVSDLLRLNGITTATELYLGRPLVVRMVTVTPTATPTPVPPSATPEPSVTPSPLPSVTPTPVPAVVQIESRPRPWPVAAIALIAAGVGVVAAGVMMRVVWRKRLK